MQNTAELLTALYKIAEDKNYKTLLSGGIYKNERPLNSEFEDMVLNTLGAFEDNFSQGIANVNVYVPKAEYLIKGKPTKLRNGERCDMIIAKMRDDFKRNSGAGFNIWTQSHQEFTDPDSGDIMINFRLEFRIFI